MKNSVISMGVLIGLLALSGCSKSEDTTTKNSSTSQTSISTTISSTKQSNITTSSITSTTSSTSQSIESTSETISEPETAWNAEKSGTLDSFMTGWGQEMGQTYGAYQPNNNVNYYGVQFPSEVVGANAKMPIAINDIIVSSEWSETGESSAEYSIVAAYSDAQTGSPKASMSRHVYLFGFTNDQPVVLVSMQNQGMPDGALHFRLTENAALTNGFQGIVAGNVSE
ncbi:DUF4767 domain-containing protein [Enterococcus gilvus]|uniref:DUF4767 domain-containing protein n=1 Tax=Enterococcus gilvus ATCC BAA-350 TaxID=1158614 RepID=R2VJH5_9ENTE|nr:DUF4767 domain-containing protein [Enterococcus gilvus]EOI57831.1 hypothetical protein UKC_00806 [Enterococcus gilvus ATCC BAA-350]EOW79415.1 hypothetical protein I592_03555 [Enterococcus gilvus ATCC BAA-350]OJG44184.1 hypothetical protein RV02_GL001582 [Enterococcus gilvus]